MRPHPVFVLTAAGLLVSACSDSSSTASGGDPGAVQAAATATPLPFTIRPVPVTLHRFPAGLAVIGLDPTVHQLTIEIKVGGLAPGTGHAARLVASSCAHPGGAVLYPLDPLNVAANAIADTRTVVSGVTETAIPATGWSLVVDGAGGRPLMCGDLENPVGQTVITAGIGAVVPPGGPDPRAAGTARLTIAGGGLQVMLDTTGLTPGSTHAALLRKGNCEGQGKVIHELAPLTADATGHATSTTLIPGVQSILLSGWFVGVSPPGVLEPVLCGNVGS